MTGKHDAEHIVADVVNVLVPSSKASGAAAIAVGELIAFIRFANGVTRNSRPGAEFVPVRLALGRYLLLAPFAAP